MFDKEKYSEVQKKIIASASDLFVKKGLRGTTVRDIANASGTNVAMVNYYFKSKENLFNKILDDAFQVLAEKVFTIIDSDLPFFDLIRKWIYSYYEILSEYPHLPIFVLSELSQSPEKLKETFKLQNPYQIYARLAIRISEEEKKGTIQQISIPDFFLNIISLSIFPYVSAPLVVNFLNFSKEDYQKMIFEHREYVADFIINAIKK
jgi:Transcriptional regulator